MTQWWILGVLGCDRPVEAPVAVPAPQLAEALGWVGEIAANPEAFEALNVTGQAGWAAMRAHEYRSAVQSFTGSDSDAQIGRGRAELALAVLYRDLAALAGLVYEQRFDAWSRKGPLPEGPEAPLTASLAAHCSGGDTAARWASLVTSGPDAPMASALTHGGQAFDVSTPGPFGLRARIHRESRASGDPALLLTAALEPVVVVAAKDLERQYWDPCVWATLSDVWYSLALRDLTSADRPLDALPQVDLRDERGVVRNLGALTAPSLASRALAPWPTAADARAELGTASDPGVLGAKAPSLRSIGLGTVAATADDPQLPREEARRFDEALNSGRVVMAALPGASLVQDLELVDRYRQEQFLVRARNALLEGNPHQAQAYLELAREGAGSEVGPRNAPTVFTLLARIEIELGHPREAADALQAIVDHYPEVIGLRETARELAELVAPPAADLRAP